MACLSNLVFFLPKKAHGIKTGLPTRNTRFINLTLANGVRIVSNFDPIPMAVEQSPRSKVMKSINTLNNLGLTLMSVANRENVRGMPPR